MSSPYRLGQKRSSMGAEATYDAVDTRVDREVVLKVMQGADEQLRARFHREARVLMSIEHENVLMLHDYSGADAEELYIASERLEGVALDNVLDQRGAPSSAAFAAAGLQMARALSVLHDAGLVHRDLRIGYFIVEENGRLVLADLSLAVGMAKEGTLSSKNTSMLLSPLYTSPEALTLGQRTAAGDVYSLGVILLHLLFAEAPLKGASIAETLEIIRTGKLRRASAERSDVPGDVRAIVDRMTSADPASRPDLGEVLAVLAQYAGEPKRAVQAWAIGERTEETPARTWEEELGRATGGRYRNFELLGQGGMGRVVKAYDDRMKRGVAIKTMLDPASDTDAMMRFHREARALGRIKHPNVIEVIDYSGRGASLPYIVLELIDGATLQQVISVSPVPEGVALCILHDLADALIVVHKEGLVHRDIKPENIFADDTGRVVLGDFGIVRGFQGQESTFVRKNTVAIGSPLFASPEQVYNPDIVTSASDMFSLGALVYALITGKSPFIASSIAGALSNLAQVRIPDYPAEIGNTTRNLVQRLLQKEPGARLSALELKLTLAQSLADARVIDTRREIRKFLGTETDEHTSVFDSATAVQRTASTQIQNVAGHRTEVVSLTQRLRTEPEARSPERRRTPLVAIVAAVIVFVSLAGVGLSLALRKPQEPARATQAAMVPDTPLPAPPPEDKIDVPVFVPPPQENPTEPVKKKTGKGPAVLHFFTKPWAKISIDGEVVGTTPVFQTTELKPGKHTFVFENPTFKAKTVVVDLQAGENKDVRVQLEK